MFEDVSRVFVMVGIKADYFPPHRGRGALEGHKAAVEEAVVEEAVGPPPGPPEPPPGPSEPCRLPAHPLRGVMFMCMFLMVLEVVLEVVLQLLSAQLLLLQLRVLLELPSPPGGKGKFIFRLPCVLKRGI